MSRRAWALAAVLWLVPSTQGAAQEVPPTLEGIEELARAGRLEEARRALLGWWTEAWPRSSRRDAQHALWLRGRLTVDPAQAALDYRRLVVEFPGGAYSDQALFRLAQGAFALGDSATASQEVARLLREYPSSSFAREAESWLAGAGSPPPPPPGADTAVMVATPAAEVAAEEAPPPATEEDRPGAAEDARPFAVQLGAFADARRAEALRARVSEAGYEARLARVPGSDLVRVRVGMLGAQADAEAILKELEDLGFTAALVKDAHREERVVR